MEIKPKDQVIDVASGSLTEVIATHTYPEGLQVASIRLDGNGCKWVPVTQLKKNETITHS